MSELSALAGSEGYGISDDERMCSLRRRDGVLDVPPLQSCAQGRTSPPVA